MTNLFEYLNVLVNLGFETYVWYKIDMFHISYIISLLFIIFPVLKSRVHSLYLFLSFFFFSFLKVHLSRGLRFNRIRALFLNYSNFCQVSIAENVSTSFANFVFSFSSEAVLQGLSKNNSTKNKSMSKFKWPETCTSSKTYKRESVLEVIATSYKTELHINITCIRMCFP